MIPVWLQHHLQTTGAWNGDGVARAAKAGLCRTCHAAVLFGLDADMCAAAAIADPTPLTKLGEAIARIASRDTYELRRIKRRYELDRRDASSIQHAPAGTDPTYDVIAAHKCGSALDGNAVTHSVFDARIVVDYSGDPPW